MKITPVNVITGFLGVGKTSSILSLLHQKPVDEEWAILVNEFGEIGVDQGLIKGQIAPRNDVMVLEVPGGCMCCAAGLPMEMALSQIFFLGEPDRLIIEPTGLGLSPLVRLLTCRAHLKRRFGLAPSPWVILPHNTCSHPAPREPWRHSAGQSGPLLAPDLPRFLQTRSPISPILHPQASDAEDWESTMFSQRLRSQWSHLRE